MSRVSLCWDLHNCGWAVGWVFQTILLPSAQVFSMFRKDEVALRLRGNFVFFLLDCVQGIRLSSHYFS